MFEIESSRPTAHTEAPSTASPEASPETAAAARGEADLKLKLKLKLNMSAEAPASELSAHDIKQLIERVAQMSDDDHWHILQIIRDNTQNKYTTNTNGVFVNMIDLDRGSLVQIHEYVQYAIQKTTLRKSVDERDVVDTSAYGDSAAEPGITPCTPQHQHAPDTMTDVVDLSSTYVDDICDNNTVVHDDPSVIRNQKKLPNRRRHSVASKSAAAVVAATTY